MRRINRPLIYYKKNNNKGATLVVVLIVVAFIAILGSVSIAGAMVNLKMKISDKKSQKTFYTCEEAVDELYTQIGKKSMTALEMAYRDVMATMIYSDLKGDVDNPQWEYKIIGNDIKSITQNGVTYEYTNAELELRKKYMKNIIGALAEGYHFDDNVERGNIDNIDNLIINLNKLIGVKSSSEVGSDKSQIDNHTFYKPYIASIGSCYYVRDYSDASVYIFNIDNIKVKYFKEDGYRSEITFDIGIKLPISDINFTPTAKSVNDIPALSSFSLIADTGLVVSDNKNVTIDGSVYAGGSGITFKDSSIVRFIGDQVITKDDIKTEKQTQITFSGITQLWCNNILIPKDYKVSGFEQPCHGVMLNLAGKTFVKNDLKINGASSKVTIGGSYSGYSNKGVSASDYENKDESSAIIVNGAHSDLKLSTSYIYIAGRSYIVYDGTTNSPYRTGESLSFKGDQEIYLVPPSAVNESAGSVIGNPCTTGLFADSTKRDKLKTYLNDTYFAKTLLDSAEPFVIKEVSGQSFIYLNFKNAKSASDYVYLILSDDTAFENRAAELNIASDQLDKAKEQKNYMLNLIKINLKDLDQQTSGFITPSGTVTTSGVMINAEINGTDASVDAVSSLSPDAMQKTTIDLTNRYKALTDVLDMTTYVESPADNQYFIDNATGGIPNEFTGQNGKKVKYGDIVARGLTVGTRIVSYDKVVEASNAAIGEGVTAAGGSARKFGNNDYAVVFANGGYTYTSSSGFKHGAIVAIGDVNVESDFDGLIISLASRTTNNGGNIIIKQAVNISNTVSIASLVDNVCAQLSDENAEKVVSAFRGTRTVSGGAGTGGSDDKISIESVRYNQLVYIDNWRKTEVTEDRTVSASEPATTE